jgi:hypothetical protein
VQDAEIANECRVEWLILADYADIVGGKLYLAGGGWDTISVASEFPHRRLIGLAVAVDVPWNQTNEAHSLVVLIQDEDGKEEAKIEGHLEVGRPPGYPKGQSQRAQLAVNIQITFERPGGYTVVTSIDGHVGSRTPFRVIKT